MTEHQPEDPNVPYADKPYVFEQTEEARDKGYYGYQPEGEDLTETYSVEGAVKAEEEAKKERQAKADRDAAKAANPQMKPTAREKWGEAPLAQAPKSQGRRSRQPAATE